jgi:hypothetical protein
VRATIWACTPIALAASRADSVAAQDAERTQLAAEAQAAEARMLALVGRWKQARLRALWIEWHQLWARQTSCRRVLRRLSMRGLAMSFSGWAAATRHWCAGRCATFFVCLFVCFRAFWLGFLQCDACSGLGIEGAAAGVGGPCVPTLLAWRNDGSRNQPRGRGRRGWMLWRQPRRDERKPD